jgi:hypothetical protein
MGQSGLIDPPPFPGAPGVPRLPVSTRSAGTWPAETSPAGAASTTHATPTSSSRSPTSFGPVKLGPWTTPSSAGGTRLVNPSRPWPKPPPCPAAPRRVGGRGRPIGLCRGGGTPPPTGRLPQPIDFRTVAKLLTGSTYRWSSKLTLLLLVTRPKRTPVLLDGTRGLHRARSTRKLYSSSPGPSSPAGVNASPGAGTAIVQCN